MGEEGEAPEMETVVITRAFKAAAALMGFMCFLIGIVTTAATSWVTEGNEMPYQCYGLFEICNVTEQIGEDNIEKNGPEVFSCEGYDEVESWRAACQALMIIGDVLMFISFFILTVGICSAVAAKKFLCYKIAIGGYLSVVLLYVITLVIYPTMAIGEYSEEDPDFDDYELGWTYGLAWANSILIFIAALFVIIDKGEELTEREKVYEEEEE